MDEMKARDAELSRYVEAVQRGADWLAAQQAPDGSIERDLGIGTYYKVPWALAVTGHTVEASRLLDWIRREALAPNGDIAGYRGDSFDPCYLYANSWIAAGAWKVGYYDLATRAMDFILTYQDERSGGFYSHKSRAGRQEIWITCLCGLAALICGRLPAAQRVADFLRNMLTAQPDPTRRFYSVYEPAGGLVTRFPAEQTIEYVVDVDQPADQWDFLPGIAAAFLGRLYMVTGDAALLDTASGYVAFGRRLSERMLSRWRVTKGGWAGAVMYLVTRDPFYREVARNVAEHYAACQEPEGYWWGVIGRGDRTLQIDVTAEIVALMNEMLQALAP